MLSLSKYLHNQRFKLFKSSHSFKKFSTKPSTNCLEKKSQLVHRLLQAKEKSGHSFDHIASHCGLTNAYCAQLFYNQAQLKPNTAKKLKEIVPGINDEDINEMEKAPFRSFREDILQEPHVYRMNEAVLHYGESLKALVNEKFGDGIMSAIDFYVTVDKIKGLHGEDRVQIIFNGKFLQHVEQLEKNNTAKKL